MSEKKISVSWKPGTGYESPLINVQGDSAAEVDHNLRELIQSGTLTRVLQSAVNSQAEYVALKRGFSQEEPPQQPPAQNPWDNQAAAQASHQAPPASQAGQQEPPWQNWSSNPQQGAQQPPAQPQGAQQGWGQQQAPAQSPPAAGGAPVCQCRKTMEYKTTSGGKGVWRCPDWRWNNGSPTTNHDQIWADNH